MPEGPPAAPTVLLSIKGTAGWCVRRSSDNGARGVVGRRVASVKARRVSSLPGARAAPSKACLPEDSSPRWTSVSARSARRSMVSDCSLASVLILQSPLGTLSTFREQKKPLALSETVEPFLKLSLGQQPTSCRSEQEQPRDEQEMLVWVGSHPLQLCQRHPNG